MEKAAIKFALAHSAVSTVIPGMRRVWQAEANTAVSDMPQLPEGLLKQLQRHNWRKSFWIRGK